MYPSIKLVVGLIIFWYPLSVVHEIGHCISVYVNGGKVDGFVWHFGIFSETVRHGSAHPIIDLWAGSVIGCIIPLIIWYIFRD
jgi:membrane-associated protease RseP (regulator of RpoE activity)